MKKFHLFSLLFILFAKTGIAQVTTTPSPPEADQPVTIFFNKAGTGLSTYNGVIYAHIGVTVNNVAWTNVKGSWGNNTTQPALTFVSGTTYSLTITPDLYSYFGVSPTDALTQICVVFRNAAGNAQSTDIFINVGAFQATLTSPVLNSTTILNSGGNLPITAINTNGSANYTLLANGTSIATSTGSSFNFTDTNITTNKNYELQIQQGVTTFTRKFAVVVNPGTVSEALPAGLTDGINLNPADATKATLVLDAPGKDFVYVAGTFNGFQPGPAYAMKRDNTPGSTRFWLELNGLTPLQQYVYQYWVVDATPDANSPALVKTADPYSTLVVNPYDDPWISPATYPDMPAYPVGADRDATVLQTGKTPYNWNVTNFVKPKKEDLIVYEVLIRDFDADRNFQDIIDKIDYFKSLKINAIQLMPIMEFEGNESWGYNTSFHMALDKFYGTADKFKELVDLCHQNGIAVILDIALNHAFGRNPMVRMWMKDPDGDGWGDPSPNNPYFNEVAKHSYNVGSDFNHQSQHTRRYVKRVTAHWINEFKIDGFRWDLTKGFTQNCSASDENCTNQPQNDRIAVLKEYVDHCWLQDDTHYAIFEHLGSAAEEQQWANYRLGEGKGIMMWSEQTYPYTQLIQGYATGADISGIGHKSHAGFSGKRVMGYPESHDKERLVYSAMTYGNGAGSEPPLNNLNNTLKRMSAIGAVSLMVPGPKMIWHFAELGYDDSIWTCNNGTVNSDFDIVAGDCKLDSKPQEQWTNNWPANPQRAQVFNDWSKMISLKINEPVFEGDYDISPDGSNIRQRIYIWNGSLPSSSLVSVVIIANFSVAAQNINPSFPVTGTWYNLMDNSPVVVSNTTAPINLGPGQFRIFGNQMATLGNDEIPQTAAVNLFPNPARNSFSVNANTVNVEVYALTGQLVKRFTNTYTPESTFDISELKPGMYVVKATDDQNRQSTMRLLKQ